MHFWNVYLTIWLNIFDKYFGRSNNISIQKIVTIKIEHSKMKSSFLKSNYTFIFSNNDIYKTLKVI